MEMGIPAVTVRAVNTSKMGPSMNRTDRMAGILVFTVSFIFCLAQMVWKIRAASFQNKQNFQRS